MRRRCAAPSPSRPQDGPTDHGQGGGHRQWIAASRARAAWSHFGTANPHAEPSSLPLWAHCGSSPSLLGCKCRQRGVPLVQDFTHTQLDIQVSRNDTKQKPETQKTASSPSMPASLADAVLAHLCGWTHERPPASKEAWSIAARMQREHANERRQRLVSSTRPNDCSPQISSARLASSHVGHRCR